MHGCPLRVSSCANVRDLGNYDTPLGPTLTHRFVRCGGTRGLTKPDMDFFLEYGVRRVLDLRGPVESPALTCRFSRCAGVVWHNVSLYDVDISASPSAMEQYANNYLVSSYLRMLASKHAIQRVSAFIAQAEKDECVLFHCAAGMDRTGIVAMLLLGLAHVPRTQVIADYAYSFGEPEEVETALARDSVGADKSEGFAAYILGVRIQAIADVYDALIKEHGSFETYLRWCGVNDATMNAVRDHLLQR